MPNAEVLSYDPTQDYLMHLARYQRMSSDELIAEFNRLARPVGIVGTLLNRMAAVHKVFDERDIDYSAIGDEGGLSWNKNIRLEGTTIVVDE